MKKVDIVKSFWRFYIKHMLFCIQQSVRYARYQQFRVSYARYQQFRVYKLDLLQLEDWS